MCWGGGGLSQAFPLPLGLTRKMSDQDCASGTCTQHNHFLGWDLESIPGLEGGWFFAGESGLPPVFFSSLALLKITVNPSAEEGSLTSHSPNLGNGLPLSVMIDM
uniref:Uncharacterized protein n=1 Tax=Opuntia streptacantha TaxID=393608 RepID=A0A7C9CEB1_OPUST